MVNCPGRWKSVEGGGLPAITNYDYPDINLYIRGTQDKSFQFEEVCSESVYLFEEKGANGGFETTTGSFASDAEDNLTGRLISLNTLYSGWYITTGSTIYDIPLSGAGMGGTRASLSGLTGTVFTQSRMGSHSPLLIDFTGADLTSSGVCIVQTGLLLNTGQRHQLYGLFQEVYSTTGSRIDFYVEGFTGGDPLNTGNVVAFYDPDSRSWVSSQPDNTHEVTNRPTDIAFDFTTALFPGVTPSGYNIRVCITGSDTYTTTDTSAHFIQVDSVHVDQYMAKNQFTDVIVPTGYLLQITPDLGWHDTQTMFGDREGVPNPHLVELGPFSITSGMIDNNDGSVTITISDDELSRSTSTNYRKYLWRAIAISDNGALGDAGFPRRFSFLGKIFDEEFTVDPVRDDPLSITKVITGTKSKRMKILVDGLENHPGLEYPTDTSWKLTIVMNTSKREIEILGKDKGGASSSTKFLTLTSEVISLTEKKIWNLFDEHGLLLGVERLPGEDNEDYAARIKDAFQSPGSHFFDGVVDGGTREVGETKLSDAITLSFLSREIASPLSITVKITSSSVLIRTSDLRTTETVLLDPVALTCELTERIAGEPDLVELVSGNRINLDQITVFDEDAERPDFKKLKFKDDSLGGKLLTITYPFYREYTFVEFKSLGTLLPAIAGFTDLLGNLILKASLNSKISGFEDSNGLYISSLNFVADESFDIAWSPLYLKKIADRVYRESFRNPDGTLWNTKFYKWVQNLKANTNIEWGHVIADKAFWNAADNKLEGFDHLPTMMDPNILRYQTTGDRFLDAEEALLRLTNDEDGNRLENRLLFSSDFLPGVAYVPDLLPSIFATISSSPELADGVDTVVGETGNASIIFFSGTIN